MKLSKILILLLSLLFTCSIFTSCSAEKFANRSDDLVAGGAALGSGSAGAPEFGGDDTTDEASPCDPVTIPAGQMTAGAHNDNDNYESWKALFEQGQESNGKFFEYYGGKSWSFNSLKRVKVTVKNGENAVVGADVSLMDENNKILFSAVTDATGTAYLFTDIEEGTVTLSDSDVSAKFTGKNRDINLETGIDSKKKNVIEIMFVIDVTGSMNDELKYVEAELSDVISKVAKENPDAIINMALLFYRDSTDNEKFSYCDFVNVTVPSGLSAVLDALKKQTADGGGDYPEAVDEAMELAVNKQWSTAASTKLIFHILDAPPHSSESYVARYKTAIEVAAKKGIRICPILCSGSDTLTEYLTRQAAIYTGGTFIFITDDSGIGGSHHAPELPDITVEFLNSLLARIIDGYYTGVFSEPIDWRQETK